MLGRRRERQRDDGGGAEAEDGERDESPGRGRREGDDEGRRGCDERSQPDEADGPAGQTPRSTKMRAMSVVNA